ncbi:unnamed protein product [Rotaria sp. Silwood2]|nr:unnamed protein product [Rotaria sp. Silwood2]CAF4262933.1 unnamed protein product [Rotaria sp. Silwood2]
MSKLLEQVLQANIFLQPFQFSIVMVINILNICVLCSRALRSSSCTHYFLAYSVFSIIYSCLACLTQFLRGFSIDWANHRIGCKLHFYILFVVPVQANLMLILASVDRYCSSLKSHRLNSKSKIQTPRMNIVIATIAAAIYMSPMLVIYAWNETTRSCHLNSNVAIYIYIFSQIVLYYVLAPLLMIIFGFLTISNIRRQSTRLVYLSVCMRRRRSERQLTQMLLLQVGVHLILTLPFGIIYCMNSLKPSTRTPDVLAVRYILLMWQQLDYFISFFLYFLSGRVYREQLLYLLKFNNSYHT